MSKSKEHYVLRRGETKGALGAAFRRTLLASSCLGLAVLTPHGARALNLYSGTAGGQDLEVNLDTTAEYSNIFRVSRPSHALTSAANSNDGDLNFQHGLVDNTFSLAPIFDLKWGSWGVHVSGEAYVDTPYLGRNQNNSPLTYNSAVNRPGDFSHGARNIEGENAILLDAFVSKNTTFSNGQAFNIRVGRQTLLWGQSLIFTGNGIAAGQAPIDVNKALSQPGALASQIFLPVGQVVASYQPNQILTIQGYYQFEWEPYSFQADGAYFNSGDPIGIGAGYLVLFPGLNANRVKDKRPTHNGQFGLSAQLTLGDYDLGFYGLRYDAKTPELYLSKFYELFPGVPASTVPGAYRAVYARDIAIYGTSISTDIGAANVGAEISGRTNMPLVTAANPDFTGTGSGVFYPVGNTLHGQASMLYLSPGIPLDPGGVTVTTEVEANHVLEVTKNKAALTPHRDSTAVAFALDVTPAYYSVLPNLEVEFPLTLTYNLLGRSQIDATMNHGTGNYSVGIEGVYRTTWTATLQYAGYLGAANPNLQGAASTADRGFINFNIEHTF